MHQANMHILVLMLLHWWLYKYICAFTNSVAGRQGEETVKQKKKVYYQER